jgi:hypothetical protein
MSQDQIARGSGSVHGTTSLLTKNTATNRDEEVGQGMAVINGKATAVMSTG